MNNKFLVGAGLSVFALAMAAKDPVIMTVDGEDVPKSEFEYLYHKNSQQQLSPQSLAEYVEMFKVYKLKVADAKRAGIDTTAAFRKEMAQYRAELAQPYLTDSLFLYQLVDEAAERGRQEVETSHIMLSKTRSASENRKLRARLDSIRTAIVAGADFGEMAGKYSTDRGSNSKGGYLGWVPANRFPYEFELAAFNTPEGEVSEVIESPMGFHLVKTGKRREARGKVHASHIMKMAPRNASPEERDKAKAAIDSIYNVVKAHPERFAEIAKTESEDRGSAVKGGELPWFGPGEMVPEFENVAFSLADGDISAPVESTYGWHIVKKLGHKGAPDAEELRPELLARFKSPNDGRWAVVRKHEVERLALKHDAKVNDATMARLKQAASQGIDSIFFVECTDPALANLPLITIGKTSVPVSEFIKSVRGLNVPEPDAAATVLDTSVESFMGNKLNETEQEWLYANNPDYRNLLNEYHDGSLLYEVSVGKVWDRAAKDKEGLEEYFRRNRDNYRWAHPHVKGILVQAADEAVGDAVRERMNTLSGDSIIPVIRKEFKGKATVERVLVEKGANAMVDNLMFGAPEVTPAQGYTVYYLYNPRVIDTPEEAADVRGAVTGDYQTELETLWVEELKGKYPVKVNSKELKKIK